MIWLKKSRKPNLEKKENVRIRNRIDLDNYIAFLLKNALQLVDILFATLLKAILVDLEVIYRNYKSEDHNATWAEINKHKRINKILNRIEDMANDDFKTVVKVIQKSQENIYIEEHNASLFIHEKETQLKIDFDVPSTEQIHTALEQPLDKLKVDKTVKKHEKDFKNKVRIIITQGLINGNGYGKVAKEIERQTEISKKRAQSIVRTEAHRSQSQAKLDSANELKKNGFEPKKRWHSTLDERTRGTHRHLDGVVKDIDEPFESSGCKGQAPGLFVGLSSAKENINCRCSMLIFLDEDDLPTIRRARNENGETYVIEDMTYREWERMKRKG